MQQAWRKFCIRTLTFSTAGGKEMKSLLGCRQHDRVTNLWNNGSCEEKAEKGLERRKSAKTGKMQASEGK